MHKPQNMATLIEKSMTIHLPVLSQVLFGWEELH